MGIAGGESGVIGREIVHEVADRSDVAILLGCVGVAGLAALRRQVELQIGITEFTLVCLEIEELRQAAGDALLSRGERFLDWAAAYYFALGGSYEGRGANVVRNAVETAFEIDLGSVEQTGLGDRIEHEAVVAAAADSRAEVEVEGRTAADAVHTIVEGSHRWTGLEGTIGSRSSSCEVRGHADVGVVFLELRQNRVVDRFADLLDEIKLHASSAGQAHSTDHIEVVRQVASHTLVAHEEGSRVRTGR